AQERAQVWGRVADVVAVTEPGQADPAEIDAALPQGEVVGERLTRMLEVRQRIDDGDARVAGERLHGGVAVDPRRDAVDPAREVTGHVGDRLPRAHPDLLARQVHRAAPELNDPDLERDARPERGFLEDQRHGPPGQDAAVAAGFAPLLQLR